MTKSEALLKMREIRESLQPFEKDAFLYIDPETYQLKSITKDEKEQMEAHGWVFYDATDILDSLPEAQT